VVLSPSALQALPQCKHRTPCLPQLQVHGLLPPPLSEDGLRLSLNESERVVSQRRSIGAQ